MTTTMTIVYPVLHCNYYLLSEYNILMYIMFCANYPGLYILNVAQHITESGVSDRCSLICGNALEQDYSSGTAFFLYLVPRGLRIFLPFLKALGKPIRVVTYMSPLLGETPEKTFKISTATHPEAGWPLFVYTINGPLAAAESDAAAASS
jgi:hypothetical protein